MLAIEDAAEMPEILGIFPVGGAVKNAAMPCLQRLRIGVNPA
jgi:hypothetical protein